MKKKELTRFDKIQVTLMIASIVGGVAALIYGFNRERTDVVTVLLLSPSMITIVVMGVAMMIRADVRWWRVLCGATMVLSLAGVIIGLVGGLNSVAAQAMIGANVMCIMRMSLMGRDKTAVEAAIDEENKDRY